MEEGIIPGSEPGIWLFCILHRKPGMYLGPSQNHHDVMVRLGALLE
jgi:hypothetical protein